MNAGCRWWSLVLSVCAGAQAAAQLVVLPSDISVGLAAEPSTNLQSWQPITFTLSVTNHGPEPVERFAIVSSPIYDELDFNNASSDCQNIFLNVVDLVDGFYFLYAWQPAPTTPLAVNETRSCHLTLPLTAVAPTVMPFSFGLSRPWTDPDPSNNEATVVLRRGVEPTAIPALSPALLIALVLLIVGCAVRAFQMGRAACRAQIMARCRTSLGTTSPADSHREDHAGTRHRTPTPLQSTLC